jgi:hypothetical protein
MLIIGFLVGRTLSTGAGTVTPGQRNERLSDPGRDSTSVSLLGELRALSSGMFRIRALYESPGLNFCALLSVPRMTMNGTSSSASIPHLFRSRLLACSRASLTMTSSSRHCSSSCTNRTIFAWSSSDHFSTRLRIFFTSPLVIVLNCSTCEAPYHSPSLCSRRVSRM